MRLACTAALLASGLAAPALAQSDTNIQFSSGTTNVLADQVLRQVVADVRIAVPASAGAVGVRTGDIVIADNAFASVGGVLTLSFNTGVASNVQAATNIAFSGNLAAQAR